MEMCRHAGRHEHASICACTHMCVLTCTHLCTPVHMHTHTLHTNSTDTHVRTYTSVHTVCACTHTVCAYTLLRARMHTSVRTHTYAHIYVHTHKCVSTHICACMCTRITPRTRFTQRDAPPGGSRDYLKGWRQCPLPPPYPQSPIPYPPFPAPYPLAAPQLQSTQPQGRDVGGMGGG